MQWLADVFDGNPTSEAAQHLQAAFIAWSRSVVAMPMTQQAAGVPHSQTWPGAAGLPANPDAAMPAARLAPVAGVRPGGRRPRTTLAAGQKTAHGSAAFHGEAVAVLVEPEGTTPPCEQAGCFAVARSTSRRRQAAHHGAALCAVAEWVKHFHRGASWMAPDDSSHHHRQPERHHGNTPQKTLARSTES